MDNRIEHTEYNKMSVINAIDKTVNYVMEMLFRPFDFGKWLTLGFVTFLSILGAGGGCQGGNIPGNFFSGWRQGASGSFREMTETGREWVLENIEIILTVGAALIFLSFTIGLIIQYLSARGTFM